MVEPIKPNLFFNPPSTTPPSFPLPPTPSSLSSYEGPIASAMQTLTPWLRWLLNHHHPKSPEVGIPASLPQADPFAESVFYLTPGGTAALRSPRKYELACNIFQTLGAGGPLYWLRHRQQIEAWEKELVDIPGDPFEFLYFLTHTHTMVKAVLSFKKIAQSSSESGLCYLTGRRPWKEFIRKQSESFDLRGKRERIRGFCQVLELDEALVSSYFEAKKWDELIHYVLKKRKNHFSINQL